MYNDTPKPPPGNYDPSGYFKNPGSDVPGPWPSLTNTAWWQGDRMPLQWNPTSGATVVGANWFNATWSSPTFDLRPEFRGTGVNAANGVPIWRNGYGAGGRLWVQVEGLDQATASTSALSFLRVQTQEFGHIYDPKRIQSITPQVDISRDFTHVNNRDSVILCFFPPGDGYPVRYWRLTITFVKTANVDPRVSGITLTVGASYY